MEHAGGGQGSGAMRRRTLLARAAAGTAALSLGGLAACGPARPVLAARWEALEERPTLISQATFRAQGTPEVHLRCTSRFFGYAAAVERTWANYGWAWTPAWSAALQVPHGAQLLAADIGGQGTDDILVFAPTGGQLLWYHQDGQGLGPAHTVELGPGTLVAGDFRGLGRADLALWDRGAGTLRLFWGDGQGGFGAGPVARLGLHQGQLVAGDVDGDGRADLCAYGAEGPDALTVLFGDGRGGFARRVRSVWPGADGSGQLLAAAFSQNHRTDLALYGGAGFPQGFEFRLGRGDGTWGPRADEMSTPARTHLWATSAVGSGGGLALAGRLGAVSPGIGLHDGASGILMVQAPAAPPAYNYSVSLMRQGSGYRLWYGGRWLTVNTAGRPIPGWDGDHVLSASSPDGVRWFRRLDAPEMYQGKELGQAGWWANNYLQPQVVRVGGTYHMFWQAEINRGQRVDTGEIAMTAADRIGISTSRDGRHWQRKTDRGVVVRIDNPSATKLGDEEVLYVADDPDHRPWWLYVFYFTNGAPRGYVRLRSADPTTFDWAQREQAPGLSQIGNGSAYADAPGGRLYLRITFAAEATGRTQPVLQCSRDGLSWAFGQSAPPFGATSPLAPALATTHNEQWNRNIYFLGLSTEDGTGRLETLGRGSYRALYAGCTSNAPEGSAIWHSQIGLGELTLELS